MMSSPPSPNSATNVPGSFSGSHPPEIEDELREQQLERELEQRRAMGNLKVDSPIWYFIAAVAIVLFLSLCLLTGFFHF